MNTNIVDYLFKNEQFKNLARKDMCLQKLENLWRRKKDLSDQMNFFVGGLVKVSQVEKTLKKRLSVTPENDPDDPIYKHTLRQLIYCKSNPKADLRTIYINSPKYSYKFVISEQDINQFELVSTLVSPPLDKDIFTKITGKRSI